MKIERMENGYKLTDLYITAALLCGENFTLLHLEPFALASGKKYFMFVIKGDPDKIRSSIDDFFNCNYKIDAYTFKAKLQNLRSRLFANS